MSLLFLISLRIVKDTSSFVKSINSVDFFNNGFPISSFLILLLQLFSLGVKSIPMIRSTIFVRVCKKCKNKIKSLIYREYFNYFYKYFVLF